MLISLAAARLSVTSCIFHLFVLGLLRTSEQPLLPCLVTTERKVTSYGIILGLDKKNETKKNNCCLVEAGKMDDKFSQLKGMNNNIYNNILIIIKRIAGTNPMRPAVMSKTPLYSSSPQLHHQSLSNTSYQGWILPMYTNFQKELIIARLEHCVSPSRPRKSSSDRNLCKISWSGSPRNRSWWLSRFASMRSIDDSLARCTI